MQTLLPSNRRSSSGRGAALSQCGCGREGVPGNHIITVDTMVAVVIVERPGGEGGLVVTFCGG